MDHVALALVIAFSLINAWGAWSHRAQLRVLRELMSNMVNERRHTRSVMRAALGSRRARSKAKVARG